MKAKAEGVIRKFDPLGRITIPKEIRDKYGITVETPMTVSDMGNGSISLSPVKNLVCPKCDKPLTQDSLYCNYCGTKLDN